MDFVDEQHAWNDVRLSVFTPLRHLRVDLLAHFVLDLAGVSREESQETLGPRVDDVNLMQRHRVHNFLALLQLTLRALHETRRWAHRIVVARSRKATAE